MHYLSELSGFCALVACCTPHPLPTDTACTVVTELFERLKGMKLLADVQSDPLAAVEIRKIVELCIKHGIVKPERSHCFDHSLLSCQQQRNDRASFE